MKLKLATTTELRSKKAADLSKYIAEMTESYGELNHALYTGKDKQTHQLAQIKKSIARAKTIQAQLSAGEEK